MRKYLYELMRIDKNGFKESIIAWAPCKSWKIIKKIPYNN